MSIGTEPESELAKLEAGALEHLASDEGHVEADLEQAAALAAALDSAPEETFAPVRLAVATALPVIAAAVMVGGVFTGIGARAYAVVAGGLGIGLALVLRRQRKPLTANGLTVVGLFAIGLLMMVPAGFDTIFSVRGLVTAAAKSGDVLRPPVGLDAGWQAIIGWLMGVTGFAAAWLAIVVRRPALAILVPLPIAAIAGISVPKDQQVGSGIAVLALFAIGLGVLSSAQQVGEADDRPPLAYELRKALRALPLIAVITVAMYGLAQANVLFPKPLVDPTTEPQKPKAIPLSAAEDRVLFTVQSSISGPWRVGGLDVYDGHDWRLPPFADNRLRKVPRSGVVDSELKPGVKATITVAGLGGTTLPGLPNMVGVIANGPKLAFDSRNGNLRVAQGQVQAGLEYTITAAALPNVSDLEAITAPVPPAVRQFIDIPTPPPAEVQGLIDQAPTTSKWDTFDYLRTWVLDHVTVSGTGVPVSVTPDRVAAFIRGDAEASPFELVAAQAMLARWIGVPSRIGYGFDGGEEKNGKLEVRPRNGATFVEVYFPGYKWLPVIGTPKLAKASVGSDASLQQFDPNVLPSRDIAVQLFLPVVVPPKSVLADQLRLWFLIAVGVVLVVLLVYTLWPALRKLFARSRRRSAALEAGPRARIALAYAEWRDHATDFGFGFPTDTPLMFLDRFITDEEHTELAWLTTRALWGDLQYSLTDELAAIAEELSRSLRRRLAQSQPATLRAVALVSRLSLRSPYAPETDLTRRKEKARVPAPVPA